MFFAVVDDIEFDFLCVAGFFIELEDHATVFAGVEVGVWVSWKRVIIATFRTVRPFSWVHAFVCGHQSQ